MATQYLNTEKLEDKKAKLERHKNNIVDYLTQIKEEYMNLIKNDYWWGPRSDAFFESLKQYWYDFSAEWDSSSTNKGIIGNIEIDFNNMISFIQGAIDLSLGLDQQAAEDIENAGGVDGASGDVSEPAVPPVVIPPVVEEPEENQPDTQDNDTNSSTDNNVPTTEAPTNGTPINVSVGGFYPEECNNENTYVAGLNYKIINEDGTPARDNIAKETIVIDGKDYQVYTYDDPETPEREHYIIGAFIENGKKSSPTGDVYSIDYGDGKVYEFVDLDTNYKSSRGSEKTPGAAKYDTYVDILSVRGHSYTNIGVESNNPVKVTNTGKTVSRK